MEIGQVVKQYQNFFRLNHSFMLQLFRVKSLVAVQVLGLVSEVQMRRAHANSCRISICSTIHTVLVQ